MYEAGRRVGDLCPEEAAARGLTILDLSDAWAPRLFSTDEALGDAGRQPWRDEYLALARGESNASADPHLELHGVSPAFSALHARLQDEERHRCHEAVDDAPLLSLKDDLAPGAGAIARARELDRLRARVDRLVAEEAEVPGELLDRAASLERTVLPVRAAQEHLVCEGLLEEEDVDGAFGAGTARALVAFGKRHRSLSDGRIDEELRSLLVLGSRELELRAALRALRERVADAAGLIEDGSAVGEQALVVQRQLDPPSFTRELVHAPVAGGAPDLVGRATDAAARALGMTSSARAQALLQDVLGRGPGRVAVKLPPPPPWHAAHMELRAEIDRGDVAAMRAGRRPERRPSLVLYARHGDGEIALVRWPTTVGGWQAEKLPSGEVVSRFKGSPRGSFVWRDLYAAPTWYPPPSTPDAELVRRGQGGELVVSYAGLGPGPFSAYGLAMLVHHDARERSDGTTIYADTQIRTHGTGAAHSVVSGASHGCHRLLSIQAVRLASFLLAHRDHVRRGPVVERYGRTLHVGGRSVPMRLEDRGTLFQLTPPVPVEVKDAPPPARAETASSSASESSRATSSTDGAR